MADVTPFTRFDQLPEFITVKELQAFFRIGQSLAYKLVSTGEIETIRLGRRYLIPRRALERFQTPR